MVGLILKPTAKLVQFTEEAFIGHVSRASYQSFEKEDDNGNERLIRHFVKNMESPLEFADATFSVECSFAAHVHYLRHRHHSQSWLSERYTEKLGFVHPPCVTADLYDLGPDFDISYRSSDDDYSFLRAQGLKKQDARYVMPQGAAVQGFIKGNARAWLNLLTLRTSKKAMPEVRELSSQMAEQLKTVWPVMMAAWEEYHRE